MKKLIFALILIVILIGPEARAQVLYIEPTPFIFPSPSPLPPFEFDNTLNLNFFSFFDVNRVLCQALSSINMITFGCVSDTERISSSELSNEDLDDELTLVREVGGDQVYQIISGLRHSLSQEIFDDYGFDEDDIVEIPSAQLASYPRADLLRVKDTNKTFYLTESAMLRYIPNTEVFNSYGNKEINIIDISSKEFNSYPQNEYIYLDEDRNRAIFKLENGEKRFVSIEKLTELGVEDQQIAPVNMTEFDFYPTGESI